MQIKEGDVINKITCPECGSEMEHFTYSKWIDQTTRLEVNGVEDGRITSVDVTQCDMIEFIEKIEDSDLLRCPKCDFEIHGTTNINRFLGDHPELIELE